MKYIISKSAHIYIAILIFSLFYAVAGDAMAAAAADTVASWRPVYDLIMRWVNFFILAFILIKFLRKPLKNFLQGQRDDIKNEIEEIELDKKRISEEVARTLRLLEESDTKLNDIKQSIIKRGEYERDKTIQSAKEETGRMIESAKQKIKSAIIAKHMHLKAEMVDAATAYALKKLPAQIDDNDHSKLIEDFIKQI